MLFVPGDVFADRHRRVREWLKDHDCFALLVQDPDHFYMLTGFHLDVAPWERPVAAVIPATGEPFLIMNELSTHHLRMATERGTLHVTDAAIYVEHPRAANRTYTRDRWLDLLAVKLHKAGFRRGRLAADRISAFRGLRSRVPGLAEFGSASKFLVEMRWRKYPAELKIMREGAALTDWGQDRYMDLIKPGMLVAEHDLEIARRMAVEGARRFPEDRVEVIVGTPVAEVDAAAQRVIEQHGFGEHIMHRTGHGMGIAGHEFPEDMAFNYRPLIEHEVYSCEPGVYIYGVGGFRQDDTVVVGKTQPEVLTKRSKRIEDQTVPV
jgi:Xaa-Pro aminopeptidase